MKIFKIFAVLVVYSFLFFANQNKILAESLDKFITVVNPVRISVYNADSVKSLENEYRVIKNEKIPATWLITYDVLNNNKMLSVLTEMDKNQELGIFLEVTPSFAEASGVTYHNSGSWHHATSVFLSGYTQNERKSLIDKVFQTFKNKFGYYPSSVGSWWTDSFSLSYMKERYGIMANLTCSDQLSTDGYQIWGQPWALPYYPNKRHAAVPASSVESKLDVVNLQWAPRDPLNGYKSSLYSTQDYTVAPKPQNIDYFRKLIELYTSYGQITVGLESDLDPQVYPGEYKKQIDIVKEMGQKEIKLATMSGYANWYRQKYSGISPPEIVKSGDLLGTGTESYWYSGPRYRLFYTQDKGVITINDLRIYDPKIEEPYYTSPNNSFRLSINIPYVLSASENPEDAWTLPEGVKVIPSDESIKITGAHITIPEKLKKSKLITISQKKREVVISLPEQEIPPDGLIYKDYSAEAIHFFRQRKFLLLLLTGKGWNYLKKIEYLIPQGEIYALYYLKSLPKGSVLVYDNECLQCSYHTQFPPPSLYNRRDYIRIISGDDIVYNSSVFEAKERSSGAKELKNTGVKYIYLVKFEGYEEKLPFSPGDLEIEKIYSNANAEIWEVKYTI